MVMTFVIFTVYGVCASAVRDRAPRLAMQSR
jgi:hypothetical protein